MKNVLKAVFSYLFLLFALPIFIYYNLETLLIGREKAFQGASQFLSLFPGLAGVYFRRGFYILSLKKCSRNCYIGFGTIFSYPTAEIGKHVYIGSSCTVGTVSFGDYATIGSNVDIIDGGKQHYIDDISIPIQEQGGRCTRVHIGEDVWIGNSSVVLANVGKKSVIGAGSVVGKDIEEYSIAVGNPATVIKKRI